MAAQGSLIAFVAINFGYSFWKDNIDNRFGYTDPVPTADESEGKWSFYKNLTKVYAIYTGGFVLFVLFLALLNEVAGVSDEIIGYLFVIFTIIVYALIGILSRTKDTHDYYVAGNRVPAVFNGMATAADWMSGASFVGMAGKVYAAGYQGLSFVVGWTGGFCLVAVLIAPYLRKFGCYTVPDFFADRYAGHLKLGKLNINLGMIARMLAILVLLFSSFTYLTAQAYSIGIIMSRFLGMNFTASVFIGLAGILFCSLLGGMRAVTWTQVAQYVVLIIAYLIPCIWMSIKTLKSPVPQFSYGWVLQGITAQETVVEENFSRNNKIPHYLDIGNQFDFWSLSVCLMIGTASLPHVLMRYFTTPSVRAARRSVAWSLFFIFLLYFTAPAYASFTKLEVLTNVVGQQLQNLPNWVYIYGKIGLVTVCGVAADSPETVLESCQEAYNTTVPESPLMFEDFKINNDVVVLAAPEISGQPYIIAGLISAGGLAAALSTADGLLLAIANSLSHDLYFHVFDKQAPAARRMLVSRCLLVVIAVLAAGAASTKPADILAMVAWAFSMAASGNFPALFLGIWWKRTNVYGAIAGIFVGFLLTLIYVFGTRYGGMPLWFQSETYAGLPSLSAAIITMPIGMAVMVVVTLLTPAPPAKIQDLVDRVRHHSEETIKQQENKSLTSTSKDVEKAGGESGKVMVTVAAATAAATPADEE